MSKESGCIFCPSFRPPILIMIGDSKNLSENSMISSTVIFLNDTCKLLLARYISHDDRFGSRQRLKIEYCHTFGICRFLSQIAGVHKRFASAASIHCSFDSCNFFKIKNNCKFVNGKTNCSKGTCQSNA